MGDKVPVSESHTWHWSHQMKLFIRFTIVNADYNLDQGMTNRSITKQTPVWRDCGDVNQQQSNNILQITYLQIAFQISTVEMLNIVDQGPISHYIWQSVTTYHSNTAESSATIYHLTLQSL